MRASNLVVQVGGLALTLGLAAVIDKRRRSFALANRSGFTTEASGKSAADAASESAFTGRASRNSEAAVSVLRAVTAVTDFLGIDFGTQIAPLMAIDHPPAFTIRGLNVRRTDFAGTPVHEIHSHSPTGKCVVALHGGAFVVQPTINHWAAYAEIARRTGATVIVPVYPLASTPQGRAGAVIPVMADLISAQISQYGAGNVSVYGDSAGAAMALSTAQLMVSRADPLPTHLVLISPWLDVTMSNPAIGLIDDPVLRTGSLRRAGQQWARELALTDPLVSPLYGSLAGLPPTALYSGNLDLLSADVPRLQQKAHATAGSDFTFILRNGALHDWAMGGTHQSPEAAAVQQDIYRQLGLTAPVPDPRSAG